jgi:two-component system chemotaxis sensor kinase CheA
VVSDVGAGVDAAAIARRAGAPVPENDDDLLALITRPGVSTRSRADHTSGRGMGMDIVARRIARLGGELSLVNRPGHGSSFAIDVPLTVHIVDGLSFVCAEQQFVAPLASIDEVLDLADVTMRETPDPTGRGAMRVFEHQDEVVPYVPLDEVFGLPHRRSARAVVVRRGGRGIAFGVDRVGTLAELVVRPLESSLVRVPGVVGATDLGDGRATLVLDLPALACSLANGGGALAAHREERR